jgi:hypothetical protein
MSGRFVAQSGADIAWPLNMQVVNSIGLAAHITHHASTLNILNTKEWQYVPCSL